MIVKRSVSDWRFYLFLSLVVAAPLSKYPSIAVPLFNFPSFRLGLYQLLAVVFILLCVRPLYRAGITFFARQHRAAFAAFVILSVLSLTSIAWSLYPARSTLLALSVVFLTILALTVWWFIAAELTPHRKHTTLLALLYASCIFGGIALGQLIIFTFTDQTLGVLCTGCTAKVFGFPRINGLAAEPQFFANAMLPFVFAALYAVIKTPSKLAWVALLSAVTTIGLTFSRGAYVALATALVLVGILLYTKKLVTFKRIIIPFVAIALGITASLLLLIASASIRYSDTPNITYETIDSITEHLTSGVIDLPELSVPANTPPSQPDQTQTITEEQFVSPGLIEASGEERLSAAKLALSAWRYHPLTVVFGVGVGNLGPFVVAHIEPSAPSNLTVYIYYILLLAELGFIGLCCVLAIFGAAIQSLIRRSSHQTILLSGLLSAFALQFLFFGSYINVVYIWLWIGIALGVTSVTKKSRHRVKEVYYQYEE